MKLHNTVRCSACNGVGVIQIINPAALRKIRNVAGISLREMARNLGLSAPYVSDIERGRRNCTKPIEKAYLLALDRRIGR